MPGINRAVVQAVQVGRSIADDVRAVFVTDEPDDIAPMQEAWERHLPGVPLVVVESPYRALVGPLSAYLDVLDAAWPPGKIEPITFVILPGVRRPTVVGADPLQPVGEAAAELAPGPAPHRRRQRPVPARGRGGVRQARPAAADRVTVARRLRGGPHGGIVPAVPEAHTPPFKRAVLALNGGSSDELILRLTTAMAKGTEAELIAVHVVEVDWTLPIDADIAGNSEEAQRVLDGAESAAEQAKVRLEPVLLQARDVGAAIVDEASERGADLLVAGLPYRTRFGGDFAIGRTVPYVLKNAPCAVWVVREPIPEEPA